MIVKPVYLGDVPIGTGASWSDAAALAGYYLERDVTSIEAQKHGSEGPDGFYLSHRLLPANENAEQNEFPA